MIAYLDTSSLVEIFVEEEGSQAVRSLVAQAAGVATSVVAYAEARSAFARQQREKVLTAAEHELVKASFEESWDHFLVVKVTEEVRQLAGDLALDHRDMTRTVRIVVASDDDSQAPLVRRLLELFELERAAPAKNPTKIGEPTEQCVGVELSHGLVILHRHHLAPFDPQQGGGNLAGRRCGDGRAVMKCRGVPAAYTKRRVGQGGFAARMRSQDAREVDKGTVVVTRNGRAVAAVVPISDLELETLSLSTNPDFLSIIERSRARCSPGSGISTEEMRARLAARRAAA